MIGTHCRVESRGRHCKGAARWQTSRIDPTKSLTPHRLRPHRTPPTGAPDTGCRTACRCAAAPSGEHERPPPAKAAKKAREEDSCESREEGAPPRRRPRRRCHPSLSRKSHRSWPTPTAIATLRMRPKKQRRKPNRPLPQRAIPRPGRATVPLVGPDQSRLPLAAAIAPVCSRSCLCSSRVGTATTTDKSLDPHVTSGSIVAAWTPRPSVR